MARAKKSRGRRNRAVEVHVPSTGEAIVALQNVKLDLQAAREKLMLVNPDTLNDEQHGQWSDEITKVSLAIGAVRKALLGAVSAAFVAELPAIAQATDRLSDDLFRLQSATDIINAVASVLGIVERIATLVA